MSTETAVKPLIVRANQNGVTTTYSIPGSNGKLYSFALQNSITGCGLGLFAQWTTMVDCGKEVIENVQQIIKIESPLRYVYCLLATLGDDYRKNNMKYEQFLLDLGFKLLRDYDNVCHGKGYKQGIYTLDIDKLK